MNPLISAGNFLTCATDALVTTLSPCVTLNWQEQTPTLDWTQEETAVHTMRACLEYSFQVVGGDRDYYQPVYFGIKDSVQPEQLLRMIDTAGATLRRSVATASPEDRAWHAYGESNPVGFAAMGVVEVSVHTFDIAQGFGISFTPDAAAAEFAIDRLFLDTVEKAPTNYANAGELLLWFAGRIPLDGFAQRENWKWNGCVR